MGNRRSQLTEHADLPLAFNDSACSASKSWEASVTLPRTEGTSFSRFTTYLVKGLTGLDQAFETRKRFSDFEWLRKTLVAHFPGVRIPSLPEKKNQGRFEDSFLESRRAGLEHFLQRCFLKPMRESLVLKTFLRAPSSSMCAVRKEFDSWKVTDIFSAFKTAYSQELRKLEAPYDDSRITELKTFLEGHVPTLNQIIADFDKLVALEKDQAEHIRQVQHRLLKLSDSESECQLDAGAVVRPRADLATTIGKQMQHQDEVTGLGSKLLLVMGKREADDAEAMLEALNHLIHLRDRVLDLKNQLSLEENRQRALMGGAGGSWPGWVFAQRNREAQLQEVQEAIERKTRELVEAEAFYVAARTIFVSHETGMFFAEKTAMQRWAAEQFAQKLAQKGQFSSTLWGGVASQMRNVSCLTPSNWRTLTPNSMKANQQNPQSEDASEPALLRGTLLRKNSDLPDPSLMHTRRRNSDLSIQTP
eukprot:gnl/MRDRNA2_/MRDRNA2_29781_c0_seq1.p1 gnl/MRDRNA2_/MRDRNA2_29781_c0~~gnl/MRDRNA2_/MRDRNA2_29781_c0_seq1.p1  ORF type:complete len:475 (+),score=90.47 gnl/MRDRNA2_/MRDRNA2_29781_c0_seq1:116-1540(+)